MIKTKRWNAPIEPDDGYRLLVTRYRPRGIKKAQEPWHAWNPKLGPSRQLHADWYGKTGRRIAWQEYMERYLQEIQGQQEEIPQLATRSHHGETITLLCFCADEIHCHRTLLKDFIQTFPVG